MSTTNDIDETRLAECPDHDPDLCLFRLSPERFGLGVEVKTVLVDRPDLAETVLADICWHAGVDPARLPLPPTGVDASVGRFSGARSFPTGDEALDRALWDVTAVEHVVARIARTSTGPATDKAREGALSVADRVSLQSPDGRLHARASVAWTLSPRPYPRVQDFRMGDHWLLVDAPAHRRSWQAWIVSTPMTTHVRYDDVDSVLKGRLRSIWRSTMAQQMATSP
jgi:hypothetical protein